jgi:hypothetical protein
MSGTGKDLLANEEIRKAYIGEIAVKQKRKK